MRRKSRACLAIHVLPFAPNAKDNLLGNLFLPLASLLSGVSMLVVGTGLMFSAIGAQASSAHFSALVTGLIM